MYAVGTMNVPELVYAPVVNEMGIREHRDREINEMNGAILTNLAGGLVGGITGAANAARILHTANFGAGVDLALG